jgi:phospholipase C
MRITHLPELTGACLAVLLAACSSGGTTAGLPSPSPAPTSPIQHVVIIVQENRTVDNLFQGFPGADTVSSGPTSTGKVVPLQPISLAAPYDLDHSHRGFLTEYNAGAMNGFDLERIDPQSHYTPPPYPAYGYVPHAESAPYFALAEQFTFADHMFQTNQGPSFPAHQFIIAGTSEPSVGSDLLVSENVIFPPNPPNTNQGCDSPPGSLVPLIDPSGSEAQRTFPCFEHPTLMDLLDAKGLSWKYYTPFPYYLWSAADAIRHLRYGPDWANVSVPETNIFNDISQGRLPAVAWVVPTAQNSDHAGSDSTSGPSWVASVVNAIGTSPYWKNSVIFVTWDDWGGWYDHVKPTIYNSYELGFRVPLIVISPYAKPGYVSHVPHEFGSILKFIEEQFGLGSLGFTDARADDLSDCFNFSQAPLPYHAVSAPLSKQQILTRWRYGPPDNE